MVSARCSLVDAQTPSRNIIGIPVDDPANDLSNFCGHLLENMYLTRFPGVPCLVMRSGRKLKAFLVATAEDPSGNQRSVRFKVKIRRTPPTLNR